MTYPRVRILDNGPQPFPMVEFVGGPLHESMLGAAEAMAESVFEAFFEAFPELRPRPFDWLRDDPEDFDLDFPPIVGGGRGVVLTEEVLGEALEAHAHKTLWQIEAGDVDSGLWAREC